MNFLNTFTHVYLIGIGGIGMSALARYFQQKGYMVAGYDRSQTPLTQQLENENITITYTDSIAQIPTNFLEVEPQKVLVIFTPAIPKENTQLNFFIQKGYRIHKRAEVLAWLTQGSYNIAIAGTHGKTSTTAMVAHLFKTAQFPFYAFLGGISQNYQTNLLSNTDTLQNSFTITEADEYDKSFLQLSPQIIVLNSIEPDHLDIYGNEHEVMKTYQQFVEKILSNGKIFVRKGIEQVLDFSFTKEKNVQLFTFGTEPDADFIAHNLQIKNEYFVFDFQDNTQNLQIPITLQVAGFHNIINATAAMAVALQVPIRHEIVKSGIETYLGVKRRFQFLVRSEKYILIDDYAHHPTEIETFLRSVKNLYPNKKSTAIFQPHLYTRTRDFMQDFAQSLALADEVWLLPIYPAREQPIQGINSEKLLALIPKKEKYLLTKEEIKQKVQQSTPELLLTIGAGDIEQLAIELASIYNILE
ncbi:MAG: UDP-N-acetylmuramate--L-alanine ligase [Microscillaceae bacterium]|nr:UDP-N-acetylmuramate--L-alanine ligase [Microscillaceae bacterium]MDW8461785.1 UDP-N-acetylmuramate--L-alanine ligase [Cytophagales bacterium]